MTDPKFLELIRAAIAAKQIPKKVLARRCKVNRPTFSYFIHGDKEMPQEVKAKLIEELDLQPYVERLGL
jgi:hypothetical protein